MHIIETLNIVSVWKVVDLHSPLLDFLVYMDMRQLELTVPILIDHTSDLERGLLTCSNLG